MVFIVVDEEDYFSVEEVEYPDLKGVQKYRDIDHYQSMDFPTIQILFEVHYFIDSQSGNSYYA